MGSCLSKLEEFNANYRDISVRKADNLNERWDSIFRYGFGALGGGSALAAWFLLLRWVNDKKIGGLSARSPKGVVTKGYLNWHVVSMSTGFLLFMVPSLLTFEVFPLLRSQNKYLHQWMNNLAMLASGVGLYIIYDCHNYLSQGGSVRSVHGVTGYVTLGLMLANWIGGFLMYVRGWGGAKRGSLKPLHKRMGMVTLIIGLANIVVGLMQMQAKYRLSPEMTRKTHVIAFFVLMSLIGMFTTIVRFSDKADPPKEE